MREHRWESQHGLTFEEVLTVAERLASLGLPSIDSEKEIICYIEEWEVPGPNGFQPLDPWYTEDVTLIHVIENWKGDFFLLAGRYHDVFQRYRSLNTYCSISHPWRIDQPMITLQPDAMFWLGFRHAHSFIRVRLHTTEIVAPGETWVDHQRPLWVEERQQAFLSAIKILDLPIEGTINSDRVILHTRRHDTPLFCSWPDAFGPCQFEFNSPDPFEFLVPATQLASTFHDPSATVRVCLTGFSLEQLEEFNSIEAQKRSFYRCSAHCTANELPDILALLKPAGRLYTTLCEFQTQGILGRGPDASAIIGMVGSNDQFHLEVRLSYLPLNREDTTQWLNQFVGMPMVYAPLSAFP